MGWRRCLLPLGIRVTIVEIDIGSEPVRKADVALFDTFAGRRYSIDRARQMVHDGYVDHVLLYTWDAAAEFLSLADDAGVSGVVLKSQTGSSLVDVIERVSRGEAIGFENIQRGRQSWDHESLSMRGGRMALDRRRDQQWQVSWTGTYLCPALRGNI